MKETSERPSEVNIMANAQSRAVPQRTGRGLDVELSDGELLERFNAARDESAEMGFTVLVRRHGPMVLRVCHQILGDRHSAEDAFQATFLVLARRAGAIQKPELLGNWLYGVALRSAWETRMRDGRRIQRETTAPGMIPVEPCDESDQPVLTLICREELEVLHDEVARLPERYRVPVVLCELEGLTYQEAARRLGCPASTIGVRLSRARERLRLRMIRRGIVPAAALSHAMFGAEGAVGLVSPALLRSTVGSAVGFAASDAPVTAFVSPSVTSIALAVLKTTALTRLKTATNLILAIGLTATIGWVTVQQPVRGRRSEPPQPARPQSATSRASPVTSPQTNEVLTTPRLTPKRPAPTSQSDSVTNQATANTLKRNLVAAKAPAIVQLSDRDVLKTQERGAFLFAKEWTTDDALSRDSGGDGLGPVYNETSCVACHGLGAPGGAGPENKNVVIVSAVTRRGQEAQKQLDEIHPGFHGTRSTVLHRFGADPSYSNWRRQFFVARPAPGMNVVTNNSTNSMDIATHIRSLAEQTRPGRRLQERSSRWQPTPEITLTVSERNSPALFGAGQIDAIPSTVLIDQAKWQPAEVRGRVSRDLRGRIGRFGWKAQISSLHEFVRGACASELGLEVTGHSQTPSPLSPKEKATGLDLLEPECDALVAYVRSLPAPVVVDPTGPHGTPDMSAGRRLFAEVGCATCHSPSLGQVRGIYSDLLLHDMGSSLNDSGNYYWVEGSELPGGPSPGEWRTPPLWGLRDSGPYMHDGRAQTLEEAIALHGGQSQLSARRYFSLSIREQAQIEAFLKSLVAPSAASVPGVMLAAELEARIVPDEMRVAEARVRQQREEADARDEQEQRDAQRRQKALEAERRADRQFPIARDLEKIGKHSAALGFYHEIVRNAPDTAVGRMAVARIQELQGKKNTP